MKFRNLGSSGLRVSVVGLGCNNFGKWIGEEAARKVMCKALDLGITLFDTADFYGNKGGSETMIGQVLGERRKDIVLASKFGNAMDEAGRLGGASRRYIMSAVEASLKRLRTDWLDLYQIHRMDEQTPIEETLRALDDLVRQGKVRYIGCSNFSAWRVVEAQWTARHLNLNAFVSCQNKYNLLDRSIERDLVPVMQDYGVGLIPWSPLASGLLSGEYQRNVPPPQGSRMANKAYAQRRLSDNIWDKVENLEAFATRRGHTLLELAFSWLAAQSCLSSIIAGATTPEQLEANIQAGEWKLTAEDLAEIDKITA